MLLFQKRFHQGLTSGAITLTYRRWQRARVKAGGRYRCHPIGVLEVDEIRAVKVSSIKARDAKLAGFDSRRQLIEYLNGVAGPELSEDSEVFRIALHHGGDGDRVSLALEAELGPEDIQGIRKKLERMDGDAPWTLETLRCIERHPRVAARILAGKLGRERDPFKVDVRKLKRLGLTQSFEVGYELAPRGKAYLSAVRRRRS